MLNVWEERTVYRIRSTQGNPLQRPSEIFNCTICPLTYCTQGLEDGNINFTRANHSEWNELYHWKMRQHITQQHTFVCIKKQLQALGETLAQKYSTCVKAIVHSEMNHFLRLMSFHTRKNFCWHKRRYFESLFYIKIKWMEPATFKILKRLKITIKCLKSGSYVWNILSHMIA